MKLSKIEQKVVRLTGKCIIDFNLLKEGDRVLVAVRDSTDSIALLRALAILKKRAPVNYSFAAFFIENKEIKFPCNESKINMLGIEAVFFTATTGINNERDFLETCHSYAEKNNFNKIALSDCREDLAEALLCNIINQGFIGSLPPYETYKDITIIRPLLSCSHEQAVTLAKELGFELNFNLLEKPEERKKMKELISSLEPDNHEIREVILSAVTRVRAPYLLDKTLLAKTAPLGAISAEPDDPL